MTLGVWIKRGSGATTDYGPDVAHGALNVVQSITGEVSGNDAVGRYTIQMRAIAAYFDIRKGDLVKIFDSPDGGATITDWAGGGFVDDIERTAELGSRLIWYTITVNDPNIQLDYLRLQASGSGGWIVNDGGVTRIDFQLQRICRAATFNSTVVGSASFDDVSGMALTSSLTVDVPFQYGELSLRDAINLRLKAYQSSFPTSRPKAYMGWQGTGNATLRTLQLNVYDEAVLLAGAPKYTFSLEPSGGDKRVRSMGQKRVGGGMETSVQAVSNTPGGGAAVRRKTSGNTSVYPNVFDRRPFGAGGVDLNAWDGPLLKAEDGLSGTQVQAIADQEIAATENPGETYTFVTADTLGSGLAPGDTVALTAADLSLSGYKRVVSAVRFWYEQTSSGLQLVREVTAGNQLIELGETGKRQAAPVFEGNATRPLPPTSVTATVIRQRYGLVLRITMTGSPSSDASFYRYHFTINATHGIADGLHGKPPPTTYDFMYIPFNSSGSVYVTTFNSANPRLESDPSNTWSWNLGGGGGNGDSTRLPDIRLYNGNMDILSLADLTQADGWTKTGVVGAPTLKVDATHLVSGLSAYEMICATGEHASLFSDTISVMSPDTSGAAGYLKQYFRFMYYATNATGKIRADAHFYSDNGITEIGTGSVGSLLTPNVGQRVRIERQIQMPLNTVTVRLELYAQGPALADFAQEVWFGGCDCYQVISSPQLAQLALGTDPTGNFSNPLQFVDESYVNRGGLSFNNVSDPHQVIFGSEVAGDQLFLRNPQAGAINAIIGYIDGWTISTTAGDVTFLTKNGTFVLGKFGLLPILDNSGNIIVDGSGDIVPVPVVAN